MEQKKNLKVVFDIPVAKRTSFKENNLKLKRKLILCLPFLFLGFSIFGLRLSNGSTSSFLRDIDIQSSKNYDKSILGHLPYEEISKDKLVVIAPNVEVHSDMSESLLKMRADAKNDGIYLVFLSGYRSIDLQERIFYSLKSKRNQSAAERARVSAPPGYSEHSTGFAIDIGDATRRETDFEVEFENTNAFRWLKMNAAKYHFKLSFNKNGNNVDYEPWHWRYEGSIEALKIFEESNRNFSN